MAMMISSQVAAFSPFVVENDDEEEVEPVDLNIDDDSFDRFTSPRGEQGGRLQEIPASSRKAPQVSWSSRSASSTSGLEQGQPPPPPSSVRFVMNTSDTAAHTIDAERKKDEEGFELAWTTSRDSLSLRKTTVATSPPKHGIEKEPTRDDTDITDEKDHDKTAVVANSHHGSNSGGSRLRRRAYTILMEEIEAEEERIRTATLQSKASIKSKLFLHEKNRRKDESLIEYLENELELAFSSQNTQETVLLSLEDLYLEEQERLDIRQRTYEILRDCLQHPHIRQVWLTAQLTSHRVHHYPHDYSMKQPLRNVEAPGKIGGIERGDGFNDDDDDDDEEKVNSSNKFYRLDVGKTYDELVTLRQELIDIQGIISSCVVGLKSNDKKLRLSSEHMIIYVVTKFQRICNNHKV